MMDYMYKGEVNISQDQLGQFLKAAESLQIKGLTDGGGENDSRDVGSTSQKRHEPTPVRKAAVPHQSRSPLVLPSHSTGELNLSVLSSILVDMSRYLGISKSFLLSYYFFDYALLNFWQFFHSASRLFKCRSF